MTELRPAMSYRQSYNGGSRACWLLFTRLSLAPVDPPASLIRHPRHLLLPRAADRPLSIGQHFDRTTHAAQSYRVARKSTAAEMQKLTTTPAGGNCTLLTASRLASISHPSLTSGRTEQAEATYGRTKIRAHISQPQICHGMRTFTVRSPQTVQKLLQNL